MTAEELRAAARAWRATDPDPETRAEVDVWLQDDDIGALREAFGDRLRFGTAGLRGPIGAGPNRMNRWTVRRVTTGLVGWLDGKQDGGPVVVGFDGRRNSAVFALDAARVISASGRTVFLYGTTVPTPELAHAVVALGCAAGVMVTASHNPPADNGYKVYGPNGAQILPADDAVVAAQAESRSPPSIDDPALGERIFVPPAAVREGWMTRVLATRVHADAAGTGLSVVYTAMHGVGKELLLALFSRAGWPSPTLVTEQAEPDAAFPTVAFPNPEERGALDLALRTATAVGADLILANDPDADRLAAVVRHGGGWVTLSGNEVGILLADDLLEHGPRDRPRCVACSIVSTSMLGAVARAHEAQHVEVLTGFKWIAHAALDFEATGGRFVLGFEEALGYSAGTTVRDKDGVSAALLLADLAAFERGRGRSLVDRMEALYRRHGLYETTQRSLTMPGLDGLARIAAAMARLRATPLSALAGVAVRRMRDLARGVAVDLETGATHALSIPSSDVLGWDLQDGTRVLARPSGTEPKIKFYVEVPEPVAPDEALATARLRARARVGRVADAIVEAAGL